MSQHIDLFLPSRDIIIKMNQESRDIELSCSLACRDIHINAVSEHLPVAHRVKVEIPVGVGVSVSPRIYKLAHPDIVHDVGASASPRVFKLAQANINHDIGMSAEETQEEPANPEQEGE